MESLANALNWGNRMLPGLFQNSIKTEERQEQGRLLKVARKCLSILVFSGIFYDRMIGRNGEKLARGESWKERNTYAAFRKKDVEDAPFLCFLMKSRSVRSKKK